jgi:hypothetical protein
MHEGVAAARADRLWQCRAVLIQGDDRARRVVDAKRPFAASTGVEIRARLIPGGLRQTFDYEVVSGFTWRKGAMEFPGVSGGRYRSRSSRRAPPSRRRPWLYREWKGHLANLRVKRTDLGFPVLDGHRCWSPSKVRASPAPVALEDLIVGRIGRKRTVISKEKSRRLNS